MIAAVPAVGAKKKKKKRKEMRFALHYFTSSFLRL
jgi:hypothetical protein